MNKWFLVSMMVFCGLVSASSFAQTSQGGTESQFNISYADVPKGTCDAANILVPHQLYPCEKNWVRNQIQQNLKSIYQSWQLYLNTAEDGKRQVAEYTHHVNHCTLVIRASSVDYTNNRHWLAREFRASSDINSAAVDKKIRKAFGYSPNDITDTDGDIIAISYTVDTDAQAEGLGWKCSNPQCHLSSLRHAEALSLETNLRLLPHRSISFARHASELLALEEWRSIARSIRRSGSCSLRGFKPELMMIN